MKIKTQSRSIRNMVVLSMSLLFGNAVYAQITTENGIHVSGGSSSAQKVSSNIGNTTVATGYNSFASGYASEAPIRKHCCPRRYLCGILRCRSRQIYGGGSRLLPNELNCFEKVLPRIPRFFGILGAFV